MRAKLPIDIRASAKVVDGKSTNRVVVSRRKPPAYREARWRRDTSRPPGVVQVMLSMSPHERAAIDEWASALKMNRSRFMVFATAHYAGTKGLK